MRKQNRWECLFCGYFDECRRLEVNELIIREIERTNKCPDRFPIYINPSTRFKSFFYDKSFQIIGSSQMHCSNKYFKPFLPEEMKDFGKNSKRKRIHSIR